MDINIKYMDCVLDCEFDYEEPDQSVGYAGFVRLETACVAGQNIYEMLKEDHIEGIEQEIYERTFQ